MSRSNDDPRQLIPELCRQLYTLGWVSGTGGGMSIREGDRIYMAPSGVQKERLVPDDIFVLARDGTVIEPPRTPGMQLSECAPLFLSAYRLRDAGAVIHSHSLNAMLATLIAGEVFEITHLEMMKGIMGTGYHDVLRIPIIENTAHECELTDSLCAAIEAFPSAPAVLVRRHGVYIWGPSWTRAKTQAECLDYLFGAAVRMHQLGIDPSRVP